MARPGWPDRMMEAALLWSKWSTCKRKHVGAAIFVPRTWAVISLGYNDTPTGWKDCGDGGCDVCAGDMATSLYLDCQCLHAEQNAVYLAARYGSSVEGCWIATTHPPCMSCVKMLTQVGITDIVMEKDMDALESYQTPGDGRTGVKMSNEYQGTEEQGKPSDLDDSGSERI